LSADWRNLLADIERVATAAGRSAVGCFSIEGMRLHERALAAGVVPRAVLVGECALHQPSARLTPLLDRLRDAGSDLRSAPDSVLATLIEGRTGDGLVGLVELPRPVELAEVLASATQRPWIALVAVDVDDPGNVGALVRTALASGAAAFVGVGRGDPFHPKAVRTSMGSVFRIPLIRIAAADAFVRRARELRLTTVAAVARGGLSPDDPALRGEGVAVCVGNETNGLDGDLADRLDARVTIPMGSPIDSYSVNAAAAILLWELGRPRS